MFVLMVLDLDLVVVFLFLNKALFFNFFKKFLDLGICYLYMYGNVLFVKFINF